MSKIVTDYVDVQLTLTDQVYTGSNQWAVTTAAFTTRNTTDVPDHCCWHGCEQPPDYSLQFRNPDDELWYCDEHGEEAYERSESPVTYGKNA